MIEIMVYERIFHSFDFIINANDVVMFINNFLTKIILQIKLMSPTNIKKILYLDYLNIFNVTIRSIVIIIYHSK